MDTTLLEKNNLAHSYIRASRFRNRFKDAFFPGDKILIYGCGFVGRAFYHDVRNDLNIIGFIDKDYRGVRYVGSNFYENVPVYSLYDDSLEDLKQVVQETSVKVLVTTMWAWEKIKQDLIDCLGNVDVISLYQVFVFAEWDSMIDLGEGEKTLLIQSKGNKAVIPEALGHFDNMFSFFLYILCNPNWKKTMLIFPGIFPDEFVKNIRAQGCLCFRQYQNQDSGPAFGDFLHYISLVIPKNVRFCGHDHDFGALRFFIDREIIIFEDGLRNYLRKEQVKRIEIGNSIYIPFGFDSRVKKVYLTKEEVPQHLGGKVEFVNMKKMWREKSPAEKNEILELFGLTEEMLLAYTRNQRDQMLLTEAFACWGYINQEEQIRFYERILKDYDQNRIIVKPHPNDMVDYKKYFPKCEVLPRYFPVEVLACIDLKIKRIITTGSSAVYGNFPGCIIDKYESDIGSKDWKNSVEYKAIGVANGELS